MHLVYIDKISCLRCEDWQFAFFSLTYMMQRENLISNIDGVVFPQTLSILGLVGAVFGEITHSGSSDIRVRCAGWQPNQQPSWSCVSCSADLAKIGTFVADILKLHLISRGQHLFRALGRSL